MNRTKTPQNNLGRALRTARKALGFSQEAFSLISGRTYISSLERGIKSPTLNKIDALSAGLGIHPLTLVTLAYLLNQDLAKSRDILSRVEVELKEISDTKS